ncbi:STAUR_1299 family protein [Myxococcaceae bacterium GXIMD 01537]
MDDKDSLLNLAFERSPAREANDAIARIREQEAGEYTPAVSYEVLLPEKDTRAWLLEDMLPRLVDYLESTGSRLPGCGRVFLSIFSGDTLYFVRARDVVALLSDWSGLSIDELKRRYGPR